MTEQIEATKTEMPLYNEKNLFSAIKLRNIRPYYFFLLIKLAK